MASTFWMGITAIVVVAIISDTIVKIIKAAKSGGGKYAERVQDLEAEVVGLRADIDEYRQRIEVLEKIVTDQKYDLVRQIDDLASNE